MVGFDPVDDKKLPNIYYGISGALSGAVTRAVAQPIDVLKIRFQLQVEPIRKGSKYYGIGQAFRSILTEEGFRALWKGHVSAQVLSVTFGMVQFISFEALTKSVWTHLPPSLTTEYRPFSHFLCGSISGCMATLAAQPFDVIRTRFVAQGEPKIYTSIQHAMSTIIREEGPRALYKGLLPTLIQIAPYSGLQFGFYTLCKAIWDGVVGNKPGTQTSTLQSLVCGSCAGLGSKVCIYPLDLVKKRLQIQGFAHGRQGFGATHHYTGFLHCIRTIADKEGVLGLYKGLSPSLLKAVVTAAISFCVYEQCVQVFVLLNKR